MVLTFLCATGGLGQSRDALVVHVIINLKFKFGGVLKVHPL